MKIKRVFAYFIDVFLVSVVSSLIFMLPLFKEEYKTYSNYYNDYMKEIMESGSTEISQDSINDFQYNISKASSTLLIIRVGTLFLYFGIFAFFMNGQTLGKRILKLRIVPIEGKLNPGLFVLRETIVTGILFDVITLVILLKCSKEVYLNTSLYLSYANYFVYFLILGFVIFRDDERGFHDLICKTKVISTKEK